MDCSFLTILELFLISDYFSFSIKDNLCGPGKEENGMY